MSSSRPITPHRPVNPLFTGHFRTSSGYEAYRPKGTNDYLLIYTLAGLGRCRAADGGEHRLEPHDLVLYAPGAYQDYGVEQTLARWELLWAHFHPRAEWLDLMDWPPIGPRLMKLRVVERGWQEEMVAQFRRVHESMMSSRPLGMRIAMNALEGLLLMAEQINPNRRRSAVDHRIRQAMDHVTRHLDQKLTLDRLAEVAGLSMSRLGHLFRAAVGVSPMEFVERQRIERARQLLMMTSLSVKEISRAVGFESPFYFSLRFKRHTAKSPRAFRVSSTGR